MVRVFLAGIAPEAERQRSVRGVVNGKRRMWSMHAVDEISQIHGRYSVRPHLEDGRT
jgi:hypothetical protein